MRTTLTKNVRIYDDIVHYLPASISNVRMRGWQEIKQYPWGQIEMRAWETINVTDLFILIAAVKAFQDHHREVVKGEIVFERKTVALRIGLKKFMNLFLHNHDEKHLSKSLKRLSSFQIFFEQANGDIQEHRYLLGFRIETKERRELTIMLSEKFYSLCIEKGWTLNFEAIAGLKSPVARALYIYLSGQRNTAFFSGTLFRGLGMKGADTDKRKALRRGFADLQKRELIEIWTEENTPKGQLFSYRPQRSQKRPQRSQIDFASEPVTG